jgi:hypothetical protein
MQVADIQGDATAATLGAQKTVAVTMVQDASFLMMLASNLYSNQKLAVVREVLCNAWDAHIESGMTATPVKVTITEDNELIIEDSGYGIPAELFPEVYGTMGGSTKRKNVAVTGGFGLGAKSPWSYVDSFRVINENQGTKTVYNLVRASVEADGMPAIQQVMQVPTERSGLTVRFQLQEDDVRTFFHYIRYIAKHGDMLVDLIAHEQNDDGEFNSVTERLPTINLDPTPGSYNIQHESWYAHYMGNHQLFVRYGAVIYPMLDTPGTKKALDLLKEFMQIVGYQKMVVQAAPGTLALTPNREALSSSKMTEDGLTNLCVDLVARIEQDLIDQIPAAIYGAIERLSSGSFFHHSLAYYPSLHEAILPITVRKYLTSPLGLAKWSKYQQVLKEVERRGFKNSNKFTNKTATTAYHRLRAKVAGKGLTEANHARMAFVRHFIQRPLGRIFMKHRDLLKQESMFHSAHFNYTNTAKRENRWLARMHPDSLHQMQQFIDTPTVFVTSRSKYLVKSIQCCPWVTYNDAAWVYMVEPRDKKKDAIIKAFADAGMKVIDLTLNHDWDDGAAMIEEERLRRNGNRPAKVASAPAEKSPNLLMSLSNVYDENGHRHMTQGTIKTLKDAASTTDTPLFYVEAGSLGTEGRLCHFGYYQDLDENERMHGVIVRNGIEENMAKRRGAVPVSQFLANKLWAKANSKEYMEYRTKQRKEAVEDEHRVYSYWLDLVAYLGIKLPGYDKLITDPAMERAIEQLSGLNSGNFQIHMPHLKQEELTHFDEVIMKYRLEELPFIVKLKALRKDPLLQRLIYGNDCVETLKKYPDRKAAIKSLVMSALKNGTTTNE